MASFPPHLPREVVLALLLDLINTFTMRSLGIALLYMVALRPSQPIACLGPSQRMTTSAIPPARELVATWAPTSASRTKQMHSSRASHIKQQSKKGISEANHCIFSVSKDKFSFL